MKILKFNYLKKKFQPLTTNIQAHIKHLDVS